ncbi:MAG: hypothetical protein JNJ46_00775 [Myxococcales bacterium]|nr:hypothetical protein [Myxococcales bacterium]
MGTRIFLRRWPVGVGALLTCGLLLALPSLAWADDDDEDGDDDGKRPAVLTPAEVSSTRPIVISDPQRGDLPPTRWQIPALTMPGTGTPIQLHRHRTIEISGPGVSYTEFEISSKAPLRITVIPGPRSRRILGMVLGLGSAGLAAASLATFCGGWVAGYTAPQVGPPGWQSLRDQLWTASVVLISVAVVGTVVGWTLYGVARTKVTVAPLAANSDRVESATRGPSLQP